MAKQNQKQKKELADIDALAANPSDDIDNSRDTEGSLPSYLSVCLSIHILSIYLLFAGVWVSKATLNIYRTTQATK